MFTDLLSSGAPLIAIIAVLALVDSTSFGTLAIPIWLLLTPGRVRVGRMLVYLATLGLFYFAIGALLLFGAASIADIAAGVLESPFGRTLLLAIGGLLIWWSFARDTKAAKARRAGRGEGRISRWRRIAMGDDARETSPWAASGAADAGGGAARLRTETETGARPGASGSLAALMGLALMAGVAEIATLLPYLAAIGLLSQSGLAAPLPLLGVAGYCTVMLLPALVLLVARVVAGGRVEAPLRRFEAWLSKNADSTFSWLIGIIGVVIVLNTAPTVLGPLGL
ncbi:hypothetical protein GCM10011490_28330 [Pseudoclavibacter endophyticus]|uniref:GAP family protein n=1 Tax=Pseudoclavibacter endophyticus TaxID=1778590 RepID=A0A6H9WLZ5_9MICO|nr:GAP family protein [Pseudoclavibacter endophyticus]KAB1646750.1 hypothetical protein F8O04_13475 [Pseudoclavibacter endophyticus]GGA75899.1 hypothetical protein GCM10011490_28330 [Pseudoclavibacter endophyticus]